LKNSCQVKAFFELESALSRQLKDFCVNDLNFSVHFLFWSKKNLNLNKDFIRYFFFFRKKIPKKNFLKKVGDKWQSGRLR
jgi:hypothetical protein